MISFLPTPSTRKRQRNYIPVGQSSRKECVCPPGMVQKYSNKISEPLLERINIHVEEKRYSTSDGIHCNAQMNSKRLREICTIDEAGNTLLKTAMKRLGLSARAYDPILKVARTNGTEMNKVNHLAEAIPYRSLGRGLGG